MAHEMELEMVLWIESGYSGSRNGRYAAIRTVRDARQGGAYINGWRELALYLSKMVVVGKLVLDLLLLNRQDLLLGRLFLRLLNLLLDWLVSIPLLLPLLLRLTQPCLSSLTASSTESPESTGSTEATTRFGSATGRYEYRHRWHRHR